MAKPKIWGRKIVWYESAGHQLYKIRGYDLSKKQFFQISQLDTGYQQTPNIYNHQVVWAGTHQQPGIFYRDLNKGEVKKIAEEGSWPTISDKFIAWVQSDGISAHNVYAYDFRTEQTIQISDDGPQQPSPTVPYLWKNHLVWMSWHTGNGDVYYAELGYE